MDGRGNCDACGVEGGNKRYHSRAKSANIKCEYEDAKLPCTMCAEKGLVCGEDQKVTARDAESVVAQRSDKMVEVQDTQVDVDKRTIETIQWRPTTPSEQTLPSFDGQYMEFYWCTSSMWFDLINDHTTNSAHPFAISIAHRFGPHISSKLVRSAVLFYSSFRKDRSLSYSGMLYLAQFYEYAREAIDQDSYVDLVYGCYIMCVAEMTCRRRLFGDFEKHANGFLISYEKVLQTNTLTMEERNTMSRAYNLLSSIARIPSSEWHQDENWFDLTSTLIQRMDSATSRAVTACSIQSHVWIPSQHYLFAAEDVVYHLCTLFSRLSLVTELIQDGPEYDWNETLIAIEGALRRLADVVFAPPELLSSEATSPSLPVLRGGALSIPSDPYQRELQTLYYTFYLQYYTMRREWSEQIWSKALRAAHAVCRLYPPPHEAHYPTPAIRFIVNRGLFFALTFVADAKSFQRMIAKLGI